MAYNLDFSGYNDLLRAIRGNVADIENTRGKILTNQEAALDIQGKQNALESYPENLNWLRESREQKRTEFAQAQETFAYMQKIRPLNEALQKLHLTNDVEGFKTTLAQTATWENLDDVGAWIKETVEGTYKLMGHDTAPPMEIPTRQSYLEKAGGDEAKAKKMFEKDKADFMTPAQRGQLNKEMQIEKVKQEGKVPKTFSHFETDDEGNVSQIKTDESGKTISIKSLGKLGKTKPLREPREPRAPSDFERKWGIAKSIASAKFKRTPTESEIADVYKSKFGTAGLFESLGITGGGETPTGKRPIPKF